MLLFTVQSLLAGSLAVTVVIARVFRAGRARVLRGRARRAVTAVLWVVEVVVPGVIGVLVLGDVLRPGWAPVGGVAIAAAVAGCVVLATSPAQVAG